MVEVGEFTESLIVYQIFTYHLASLWTVNVAKSCRWFQHMMYTQIMDALIDGSALIEKPYPNGVSCQTHQPKTWVPSDPQVTDPSVNMTGNIFNFSGLGKHSNNKWPFVEILKSLRFRHGCPGTGTFGKIC